MNMDPTSIFIRDLAKQGLAVYEYRNRNNLKVASIFAVEGHQWDHPTQQEMVRVLDRTGIPLKKYLQDNNITGVRL